MNRLSNTKLFRKGIILLFGILFLSTAHSAFAQDARLEAGRYILADINVTGKMSYNEQTVVTFTGLEKGQAINVPGEEISAAIKNSGNWVFLAMLIFT